MKIILSLVFVLFSVSVLAQEDISTGSTSTTVDDSGAVQTQSPDQQKTLQKIEITGSLIKRVDEEGPAPIQTISKETIQKSGYNSVADIMRDNAFTTGGQRESSLSGIPGAATAGIGPFGAESILVLIDGQRLPKIGGYNSVDLNLIPTSAIERIDILKDGASATYGSDAIGGVMNIITKKDFNGASFNIGQTVAEAGGAARTDFNATFGKTFEKGSVMGVIQYRHNDPLKDADRPFTRVQDLAVQGSFTSGQGTWYDQNGVASSPNCPAGQQLTDPFDGSVYCLFDYSQYSWNLPQINQSSALLSGSYKVNNHFQSRTQAVVTNRDVFTRLAPAPGMLNLPQSVANNLGLPNVGPGGATVSYRLLEGGGTRDGRDSTLAYNLSQTFEGQIAGSWSWNTTGTYGVSRSTTEKQGYADRRVLQQLINEEKFNPLAPLGQKGDISTALFNPTSKMQSSQSEIRSVASGQLYDGGSSFGPIALAVGASANWQDYREEVDAITASGNSYGDIGGNGLGSRNYTAVFQELSVFPVESVEIGLAARMDRYSDFGSTFNPKLSMSWQATEKFLFRTSVGTGFRAPNLADMYSGGSTSYPSFADLKQCAAGVASSCNNKQYQVDYSSNPNLTQETSVFYNLGFLAQPKKNWNIESNFFLAEIKDGVGTIDNTQLMRAEMMYGAAYLQNEYGININRLPNGNLLSISMPSAFNISTALTKGLDFTVSNLSKANIGSFPIDFVAEVNHIHFLGTVSEEFPGLGTSRNRNIGFRNTASLSANHKNHTLRFVSRTMSGGDKAGNEQAIGVVGAGSLRTHTEFDLNYTISNVLQGGTFSLGVKNLFDVGRPLDETAQTALNVAMYDPIGRYFFSNIQYTF